MKTNTFRLTALLLLAPMLVATSGCVAARNAATDTVSWIRGALEVTVDAPIDRVGKAATATVREMKFALISSKVDVISGEVVALTAQDTKIEILMKKVGENTTHVSIRVGAFGDQAVSQQIYDELKKNL